MGKSANRHRTPFSSFSLRHGPTRKARSILPYSLTDELNRRNLVGIPLEDSPERAIYLVQNNHHGHCEAHRYLFEQLRYLF